MPEYIEREQVKEVIQKVQSYRENLNRGALDLNTDGVIIRSLKLINQIPTADVVEVVRCKYCKHRSTLHNHSYKCLVTGEVVQKDDFCSYGERKEGAEE